MIRPDALQAGDRIAIVSTARKLKPDDIVDAMNLFRAWGLEVIEGEHLYSEDRQFAGTDSERAADLQQILYDKSIRAIFCARGGYGTVRIIDKLDFRTFNTDPKWICGFSDVTALHAHVQQHLNCESMHMAMPLTFPITSPEALERSRQVLFGEKLQYNLKENPLNRSGDAEGVLIGGNLSVLYSLLGSGSFPKTENRILFLEDLDEYLYHIDRMMMALKRAKVLEGLAGLVIGGFSEMRDNEIPFGRSAQEIILEAVADFSYPVAANMPAGHIRSNMPLVMGRKLSMKVEGNSTLIFA